MRYFLTVFNWPFPPSNKITSGRSKEMFSSSLDGIDGLGPKLKLSLIRYFGPSLVIDTQDAETFFPEV